MKFLTQSAGTFHCMSVALNNALIYYGKHRTEKNIKETLSFMLPEVIHPFDNIKMPGHLINGIKKLRLRIPKEFKYDEVYSKSCINYNFIKNNIMNRESFDKWLKKYPIYAVIDCSFYNSHSILVINKKNNKYKVANWMECNTNGTIENIVENKLHEKIDYKTSFPLTFNN